MDCIWDRQALSGVAPADRTAYSQVMATLLAPQFGHLIEDGAAATEDGTRLTYDEILNLFPYGQVQSMMKNGYYVITRKEGQHLDHWHDRWAKSNIGWHRTEINSHLMTHYPAMTGGKSHLKFFFPLCGKAKDMLWIYQQGHDVVGVEAVTEAVRQFFEESEIEFTVEKCGQVCGPK